MSEQKAYIVSAGAYSDYHIVVAVSLDETVANELVEWLNRRRPDYASVEEFTVVTQSALDDRRPLYWLWFDREGNIVIEDVSLFEQSIGEDEETKRLTFSNGATWEDGFFVSVRANSPEAARKIASERRARFLADEAGLG